MTPINADLFAAAIAENMTHPAMSGADPLTECLAEQCLCFSRQRAPAEPNVIPVGRAARWWLAFRQFWL